MVSAWKNALLSSFASDLGKSEKNRKKKIEKNRKKYISIKKMHIWNQHEKLHYTRNFHLNRSWCTKHTRSLYFDTASGGLGAPDAPQRPNFNLCAWHSDQNCSIDPYLQIGSENETFTESRNDFVYLPPTIDASPQINQVPKESRSMEFIQGCQSGIQAKFCL